MSVDEKVMRDYLLGQLDSRPELVESFEERCITDLDFSEQLDVLEDEILEEYSQGALCESDKLAVETHFLIPPERQQKLRTLRLLLTQLTVADDEALHPISNAGVSLHPGFISNVTASRSFARFAIIAAILVFTVPAAYLLWSKHQTQIADVAHLQQPTAITNGHPSSPTDLTALSSNAPSEIAVLNLLQPGLTRGNTVLPHLDIADETRTVHIRIAVPSANRRTYSIQLRSSNSVVTTQDVKPELVTGGALLTFDLPASIFPTGECEVIVRQNPSETLFYRLLVSKSPH